MTLKIENSDNDLRPAIYISFRQDLPRPGVWVYGSSNQLEHVRALCESGNYKVKVNFWSEEQANYLNTMLGEAAVENAEKVKFHNWQIGDRLIQVKVWRKAAEITRENLVESVTFHAIRRLEDIE